jgi:hypothetical protein
VIKEEMLSIYSTITIPEGSRKFKSAVFAAVRVLKPDWKQIPTVKKQEILFQTWLLN